MTNNQLTDEELQTLIIELQQTAYRLNGTNSAYLMSDAIKPLHELQELRKASAEPVAYLVCNGRLYQDRPFLSLSAARISVNDRNDGAEIKALCVIETLTEEGE